MLSPIEAAALENIAEDRCNLQEVKDRLELRGIAREVETERAVEWLVRERLVAPCVAGRYPIYRATPLGELELTRLRRRRLALNALPRRAAA